MEILDPLTYKIIGYAMTAHRALGSGFPEVIDQRSLAMNLRNPVSDLNAGFLRRFTTTAWKLEKDGPISTLNKKFLSRSTSAKKV